MHVTCVNHCMCARDLCAQSLIYFLVLSSVLQEGFEPPEEDIVDDIPPPEPGYDYDEEEQDEY